jgi:hypothetical protein
VNLRGPTAALCVLLVAVITACSVVLYEAHERREQARKNQSVLVRFVCASIEFTQNERIARQFKLILAEIGESCP